MRQLYGNPRHKAIETQHRFFTAILLRYSGFSGETATTFIPASFRR